MATTMVSLDTCRTSRTRLGVQRRPQPKQRRMCLIRLPRRAHMPTSLLGAIRRHQSLALDTRASRALWTNHNRVRHNGRGKATEIFPAHISCAPAGIRPSLKAVARAEVEHFAKGPCRDDGSDIVVGRKHAAPTVHTEQTGVVARVNGACPILVDAGGAVSVGTGRTAA